MSLHLSSGVIAMRAASVSSGVLVSTSPMRLDILWTCVSTQTEGISMAYERTHAAVFLPTMGSPHSSSVSSGTSPPYSSSRMRQQETMAFYFWAGKPAGRISSATAPGSARDIASMVGYARKRLSEAFRVLSSFVLWERMVAIRTWKGSHGHSGLRPSEFLPG